MRRGETLDDVNLPRVNAAAALHGGVEFASDVALLGLGRLLPGGAGVDLLKGLSTPARIGVAGATGAGTESAEEATQTAIEYWGAEKELGTPEMWRDVRQGAFAVAIGGGAAGTVVGAASVPVAAAPGSSLRRKSDILEPPRCTEVDVKARG